MYYEIVMDLSKSIEDYLEAILVLSKDHKQVHSIEIAKFLKVSKPAVAKYLKHLANLKFIKKTNYSDVALTKKGKIYAEKVYYRHITIKKFLLSLGVSEKMASIDCCKIEHVISDETLKAIDKYLKIKA